jgi:hypothetical protein
MQETAARDTPGAGSAQFQVIRTPDNLRDQQTMTVEHDGRIMEISITEMEFYCDLFEEMLEDLDRHEPRWADDLEGLLDEFDRAEIEHLRLQYGTVGPF